MDLTLERRLTKFSIEEYFALDLNFFFSVNRGFYIINHMTNNLETLEFAVEQGANAIEMDLQFDKKGNPTILQHARFCDCTCMCPL